MKKVQESIDIYVQRGYSAHTKLVFPELGNEAFGAKRSRLVVKFK